MSQEPRLQSYLVVENFKNADAAPIYRRFRDQGRLAPEGLEYVASWVTADMTKCYQIMRCADRRLLERWIANWSDLIDFEVLEVMSSAQALEQLAPWL